MKKNTLLLGLDIFLASLLFIVAISGQIEHHPPPRVHGVLAILLLLVSLFHLVLHWPWIKHAFAKYSQLPKPTRINFQIVIVLLINYTLSAGTGLLADHTTGRLLHHALTHLHQGLGVSTVALQCWHIAKHWGWVKIAWARSFARSRRAA